jgi:hypothetical protein
MAQQDLGFQRGVGDARGFEAAVGLEECATQTHWV